LDNVVPFPAKVCWGNGELGHWFVRNFDPGFVFAINETEQTMFHVVPFARAEANSIALIQ
jgi:hypothetical protein